MQNNKAHLVGTICSPFEYSHSVCGEAFYKVFISTMRISKAEDIVPVMVSARIVDTKQDLTSYRMEVIGSLRSYNKRDNQTGKSTLLLYVWADILRETDMYDCNLIEFDGYLCRTPIYRITPLGREITDLSVAVNRPYGKTDYMPAIAWGRNARYVSEFGIGDQVVGSGRFQCRNYLKVINGTTEQRVAYEVSVITFFDEGNEYEQRETDKPNEVLQ